MSGGRDWHAVVTSRNHSFFADQVCEWDVRRIAAAVSHDIGFGRPGKSDCLQEIVEHDTLPGRIELEFKRQFQSETLIFAE